MTTDPKLNQIPESPGNGYLPSCSSNLPEAKRKLIATPSLRATLIEGLSQMFAFERGGGLKTVCLFAASIATLSWAVDSLLPVLQEASRYLMFDRK